MVDEKDIQSKIEDLATTAEETVTRIAKENVELVNKNKRLKGTIRLMIAVLIVSISIHLLTINNTNMILKQHTAYTERGEEQGEAIRMNVIRTAFMHFTYDSFQGYKMKVISDPTENQSIIFVRLKDQHSLPVVYKTTGL